MEEGSSCPMSNQQEGMELERAKTIPPLRGEVEVEAAMVVAEVVTLVEVVGLQPN